MARRLCLGAGAETVFQLKPWTAELSAADVGDFATHPAFNNSNMMFSAMWMLVFGWFAFANWQELSPWFRWVPMIAGGIINLAGPKRLMNIGNKRGIIPPRN